MVPARSAAGALTSMTRNGVPISAPIRRLKGIDYAVFDATQANYVATYAGGVPETRISQAAVSGNVARFVFTAPRRGVPVPDGQRDVRAVRSKSYAASRAAATRSRCARQRIRVATHPRTAPVHHRKPRRRRKSTRARSQDLAQARAVGPAQVRLRVHCPLAEIAAACSSSSSWRKPLPREAEVSAARRARSADAAPSARVRCSKRITAREGHASHATRGAERHPQDNSLAATRRRRRDGTTTRRVEMQRASTRRIVRPHSRSRVRSHTTAQRHVTTLHIADIPSTPPPTRASISRRRSTRIHRTTNRRWSETPCRVPPHGHVHARR